MSAQGEAVAVTQSNQVSLDASIEGIMIQISSSNIGSIVEKSCRWLFDPRSENLEDRAERKKSTNGVQILAHTQMVETAYLLSDLAQNGWEIVDAYAQNREEPNRKGHYYCTVRFIFGHASTITPEVRKRLGTRLQRFAVEDLLKKLCGESFWRVRGFRNPLARPDSEGKFGISLNFESRVPRFDGNGNRILQREKIDGVPVGDPLPLVPSDYLRLADLVE